MRWRSSAPARSSPRLLPKIASAERRVHGTLAKSLAKCRRGTGSGTVEHQPETPLRIGNGAAHPLARHALRVKAMGESARVLHVSYTRPTASQATSVEP